MRRLPLWTLTAVVLLAGTAPIPAGCQESFPDQFPVLEAMSLLGQSLHQSELPEAIRQQREAQLREARDRLLAQPQDADAIIWVGRRLAYLGRYREAAGIFSCGHAAHPGDARFLRHRGHRMITLRRFKEAAVDLQAAAQLVRGQADLIEPDGLPNARNIPTSTLQSNIWYHLGLAHYLSGSFGEAAAAYRTGIQVSGNPDMLCAMSWWFYLSLRRAGADAEAVAVLAPISAAMEIIENRDYHRLLLMAKGEVEAMTLEQEAGGGIAGATVGYGIGVWHLLSGREESARTRFAQVVKAGEWAAFGSIAAEAELARDVGAVEPASAGRGR